MSISQHAVRKSMHCYKQVTLSTSETPVKEGLRRNYYKTALLSQVALRSRSQTKRAVKAYFVLDAEQIITAAIFAQCLDAETCLPTEYSGYACAAAATVAAAAAV